jgi:hypothetical protein
VLSKEELAQKRLKRSQELADKLKNGTYSREDTGIQPLRSSWYPPRPKIAKDPEAIKKLYGDDEKPLK